MAFCRLWFSTTIINCDVELVFYFGRYPSLSHVQNSHFPEKQGIKIPFQIIGRVNTSQTTADTDVQNQILVAESRIKL